jgi:hypothetical protein
MSATVQENNPTNSGGAKVAHDLPKKGDRYRCEPCGIEIELTTPTNCEQPVNASEKCCDATHGVFQCFGHVMTKV